MALLCTALILIFNPLKSISSSRTNTRFLQIRRTLGRAEPRVVLELSYSENFTNVACNLHQRRLRPSSQRTWAAAVASNSTLLDLGASDIRVLGLKRWIQIYAQ